MHGILAALFNGGPLQPISWISGAVSPGVLSTAKTYTTYPISNSAQSAIAGSGPATVQIEILAGGARCFLCTGWYENRIYSAGKDPRNPAGWASSGSGAATHWSANNKVGAPDGTSTGAQASVPSGGFSQYQMATGLTLGKPMHGYSWCWQGSGTTSTVAGVDLFTSANHWSGVAGGVPISAAPTRVGVSLPTAAMTGSNCGLVPADGRNGSGDTPVGPAAGARDYYVACSQITQTPEALPYTDSHTSGFVQSIPGNAWYDGSGYFDVKLDDTGIQFLFAGAPITLLGLDYYFWYVNANNNCFFRASDLKFVLIVNGVSVVSAAVSLPAAETNVGVVRIQHTAAGLSLTVGVASPVTGAAQPPSTIPDLVYLNCDGLTQALINANVAGLAKPFSPFVRFLGSLVPAGVAGHKTPIKRLLSATGTSQVLGTGASAPAFNFVNQYNGLLGSTLWEALNFGVGASTVPQLQAVDYARIDETHNSLRPKQIVVCWGGTNDLLFSVVGTTTDTDAQIAANVLAWAADRHAQGDQVQVIGIIARGSTAGAVMTAPQVVTFNNRAFTINGLIAAGCTGAGNGLYFASSVTSNVHFTPGDGVTPSGAENDASYYTDKVHLTDLGQGPSGVAGLAYADAVSAGLT